MRFDGKRFDTAVKRWAAVGPYYAMFPVDFAFGVVERYSSPGDAVLDPFAGRGSSIYAAASSRRSGYGIEINPVGWLYGNAKLRPAAESNVVARLNEVARLSHGVDERWAKLPRFFHLCFSPEILRFLLTARRVLDWKSSAVDRTLMAFLLVYLHGKRGSSLSNQLRDGKAMAPQYAVQWWRTNRLRPPKFDPASFIESRIAWRYRKGKNSFENATIHLGDSTAVLRRMVASAQNGKQPRFNLLFTSPPYCGITNYHYDQWLRLWLLGGPCHPSSQVGFSRGRFESQSAYRGLIENVFRSAKELLGRGAVVYVRTDAREFTLETTIELLQTIFPRKRLRRILRPLTGLTQTALFGDQTKKPGDVDLILR